MKSELERHYAETETDDPLFMEGSYVNVEDEARVVGKNTHGRCEVVAASGLPELARPARRNEVSRARGFVPFHGL